MASARFFTVQRTTHDALAYLEAAPLAFLDSFWLDTHLCLLRAAPDATLAVFDRVADALRARMERLNVFSPGGAPVRCAQTGLPTTGPRDAAGLVRRRRELITAALAPPSLSVGAQMDPFEIDH